MSDPKTRFFLGVDLGQAADFTAMALLERPLIHRHDPRPIAGRLTRCRT